MQKNILERFLFFWIYEMQDWIRTLKIIFNIFLLTPNLFWSAIWRREKNSCCKIGLQTIERSHIAIFDHIRILLPELGFNIRNWIKSLVFLFLNFGALTCFVSDFRVKMFWNTKWSRIFQTVFGWSCPFDEICN